MNDTYRMTGNQGNESTDENNEIKTDEKTLESLEMSQTIIETQISSDIFQHVNIAQAISEATPSAPSAPEIEDDVMPEMSATLLYPNLKTIDSTKFPANVLCLKERIILQPFTFDQLKELYYNPELHMAEAFESDFINTELNNTYKDHTLQELIKKYSHSRYNLKINMLDLHAYIKYFQENSQKVWIIENRISSYEGVCADGERVRKNELYE